MKKLISIILSVILCISLTISVFALDILEEAVKKFQELYPDVPYQEIVDVISSNEGLDTAKIKEALDAIVSKYTTAPTEPTTKKQSETTTKKNNEDTGTTKKQTVTTQPTTSFTYPTRSSTTSSNNATSSNSINIVLPNQVTTEQQSTQPASVFQVQPNTYPNLNNNTTQAQNTSSSSKGLSSKTIMAIVIIAVGGLLLLVCIIVLATSSNSSNLPGNSHRRRRRKHSKGRDDALKGYVPFAQAVMPEVKINTAADMAAKKKGNTTETPTEKSVTADGKYNLSAFDIPINTYSPDGTVDTSTAEAIDAAIAYVAAKAAEYNSDYKNSITSEPAIDKTGAEVAAVILNESVNHDRICPDCGKYVEETIMFCPECGAFMGIVNDTFLTEESEEEQVEATTVIEEEPKTAEYEHDISEDFNFEMFEIQSETDSNIIEEIAVVNEESVNEDSFLNIESAVIEGRHCPECNAVVEDGLMFCPECGFFMDEDKGEKDTITDADEAFSN